MHIIKIKKHYNCPWVEITLEQFDQDYDTKKKNLARLTDDKWLSTPI